MLFLYLSAQAAGEECPVTKYFGCWQVYVHLNLHTKKRLKSTGSRRAPCPTNMQNGWKC